MPPGDFSIARQSTLPQLHQLSSSQESAPKDAISQHPTQRKMGSTGLTSPSTPKPLSGPKSELLAAAAKKAETEGPPKNSCPSRKDVATRLLTDAGDKAKEARSMGVDVAKSSFWKKMLGVAVGAVAVGVAAALTAVSFGGAAPLLGLACASLAVSIGDAVCSYRNLKNTEATANHQPLPYKPLPGGNSILGNVGYSLAKMTGKFEDSTCKGIGVALGTIVGGGLAITSVVLSLGLAALPETMLIVSQATTSVHGAISGYAALTSAMTSDIDKEDLQTLKGQTEDLAKRAMENDSEIDATSVNQAASEATKIYDDAMQESGFAKDVLIGVGGFLGPIGALLGPAIGLGGNSAPPPPESNMVRV